MVGEKKLLVKFVTIAAILKNVRKFLSTKHCDIVNDKKRTLSVNQSLHWIIIMLLIDCIESNISIKFITSLWTKYNGHNDISICNHFHSRTQSNLPHTRTRTPKNQSYLWIVNVAVSYLMNDKRLLCKFNLVRIISRLCLFFSTQYF